METSNQSSYVIQVFPDYCSNGIWDMNGRHLSYSDVPLSNKVVEDLKKMSSLFDKHDVSYLDKRQTEYNFSLMSYNIAVRIKKELPHYTVLFLREYEEDLNINREPFSPNKPDFFEVLESDEEF